MTRRSSPCIRSLIHIPEREEETQDSRLTGNQSFRQSSRRAEYLSISRHGRGPIIPPLRRGTPRRRAAWYRDYIETLVQRDVRDLARIRSLDTLPRLLALAAGQTARLLNVNDLAGPFQLSRPTIRDYVTLLERVFLLEELPPWHTNRLSRLVKTPPRS